MGAGASVLCGGQRRLQVHYTNLHGLIVYRSGFAEIDSDLEAIESDEITIDYDHQPDGLETELSAAEIDRIAMEWERN